MNDNTVNNPFGLVEKIVLEKFNQEGKLMQRNTVIGNKVTVEHFNQEVK